MRVFLLMFVVIFSIQLSHAENVEKTFSIEWDLPLKIKVADKDVKILQFKGQNEFMMPDFVPVYNVDFILEQWDGDTTSVKVSCAVLESQLLDEDEKSIIHKEALSRQLKFRYYTFNKVNYLRVSIPVVFNESKPSKLLKAKVAVEFKKFEGNKIKSASIDSYASNSLLATGNWVKLSVNNNGIYRIPYDKISSWGFSDPSAVKIYGQGGKMLPKKNNQIATDDLTENYCWHYKNAIYFYAQGPAEWSFNSLKGMFTHQLNDYSSEGYYFISDVGAGKTVTPVDYNEQSFTNSTSEFDDYGYYEKRINNVIESGRTWYGERLGAGSLRNLNINFSFDNIVEGSSARIATEAIGRSESVTTMNVFYNSQVLQTLNFYSVILNDKENFYAREGSAVSSFIPTSNNLNFSLVYNYKSTDDAGYLDKIDVQVRRMLKATGDQMTFRDQSVIANGFCKYNIELASESQIVWDVTDKSHPFSVPLGGTLTNRWFVYPSDELKEFVVFSPDGSFPVPGYVEKVNNQNLHGSENVDYVIVSAKNFLTQAQNLATFYQNNGLSTKVVTQEQIFNEFSSGVPDVTAIRSFVRMMYVRAGNDKEKMPKYLLLFGDGSYDNSKISEGNYVLTYESINSINYTSTYVTDDFYGFLDDNEGNSPLSDVVDIGIGRFPVRTVAEAEAAVAKSIRYAKEAELGKWRNAITFLADDGDSNSHMTQANTLAEKVKTNYPQFNVKKIFFDAYPRVSTSSGVGYPDVNAAVEETIDEGTLIFNYTGHGSTTIFSSEKVISNDIVNKWTNSNKMPLFVTATCEVSCYDGNTTSIGENIFLNPLGGAIGLVTTTRIVYSNLNYEINNSFYSCALDKDEDGLPLRLGDIIKKTKRMTSSTVNKLNFTLLGDPAVRLAAGSEDIETELINTKDVTIEPDTLKALSVASIKAGVKDAAGNILTNFNGYANITLYDKPVTITTLNNLGSGTITFESYDNILYDGTVKVEAGVINTTFVVPKDIQYNVGEGRLSYFAYSDGKTATGFFNKVKVGGFEVGTSDTEGPEIRMWLNDSLFVDNSQVGTTPLLVARVFDKSGINTSGIGIGHDIMLTLDDGESWYNLNKYYTSDLGSYQRGTITYQLPQIAEGEHTARLKVWDSYNNSSSSEISFKVVVSGSLSIDGLEIYPVPVKKDENLMLTFNHDDPNATLSIDYRLIDLSGQTVMYGEYRTVSEGVSSGPIIIKMISESGRSIKRGLYILQVIVETDNDKKTTISQKIVVVE